MRKLISLCFVLIFSAAIAADITILPIDRAKLLAGSLFDFRVEVAGVDGEPSDVSITVNGEAADSFFGRSLMEDTTEGTVNYMVRDVIFATPGDYTITVSVTDAAGTTERSVAYEVVGFEPIANPAKNVILFVSDGMTFNQMAAARLIAKGMQEGKYNSLLAAEKADAFAIITTSGMDSIITDSANSASAYSTGHKSAVNALGVYPANLEDPNIHPKQELLTEILRRERGAAIGVVTNTHITDATPAAYYAHTRRRAEHAFIAETFLDGKVQPDVFMGGGARWFIPQSAMGSRRSDERDLISEAEAAGYEFVSTASELAAAAAENNKLLGFFHEHDMSTYLDREYFQHPDMLGTYNEQPLLWDMVMKAIDVLSRNDNGFFLIVESGMNDKLLHPLDWQRATWDVLEFDRAIEMAKAWAVANGNETLILTTADHGHGFSTYGAYDATQGPGQRDAVGVYSLAGFPTYGDRLDRNGFPVPDTDRILAAGIANHPDYCELYIVTETFMAPALRNEDGVYEANPARCEMGGTLMQGNLPFAASTGVHTLDDVPLYAFGPGADYFLGVMDNTEVFFGMIRALGVQLTD